MPPPSNMEERKQLLRPEELTKQKQKEELDREARIGLMKTMYKEIEGLQV
jgi:hypothetical protein